MSANHNEDVKYVGDSRIVKRNMPNIPKDYSEFPGKSEPFWPNFLLKEWLVGAVVLMGFLILTVSHEAPLEIQADPTDTNYAPVPDWYFLFLFELLKYSYLSGPFTVLGAIVIPGIAVTALLLAPWLDRGPHRRPAKRPIAVSMMLLVFASIFYLTYAGYADHDWSQSIVYDEDFEVQIDLEHAGYEVYAGQSCIDCHGDDLTGGAAAPAIYNTGIHYTEDEVRDIIINGYGDMPPGTFDGTDEELDTLVQWLASLDEVGRAQDDDE